MKAVGIYILALILMTFGFVALASNTGNNTVPPNKNGSGNGVERSGNGVERSSIDFGVQTGAISESAKVLTHSEISARCRFVRPLRKIVLVQLDKSQTQAEAMARPDTFYNLKFKVLYSDEATKNDWLNLVITEPFDARNGSEPSIGKPRLVEFSSRVDLCEVMKLNVSEVYN